MPDSIPTRVARGVRYLDDHKPEWRLLISAEDLDMASCKRCVLGQLYADYCSGAAMQAIGTIGSLDSHIDFTADLGMNITTDELNDSSTERTWEEMTAEWRKHLADPEYIQEFP